jgi:hypothetical protein
MWANRKEVGYKCRVKNEYGQIIALVCHFLPPIYNPLLRESRAAANLTQKNLTQTEQLLP